VKVYLVGGAVRDELLGQPVKEKDYVVVGASVEDMVAQGFKPVGKDFPVFLHPKTHEEYALARTERKTARGYRGFVVHAAPDVTLEEDLRRRDLTINAMARDLSSGELIDPFQGRQDLQKQILRHVSDAFAEDPVRILRVARFAARFGFEVHGETMQLMRAMVDSGEADALVPERVWQEFAKGLAEKHAERMFDVLEASGLMQKLLPEVKTPRSLSGSLPVRFALIAWPMQAHDVEAVCERLRAPNEVRELAVLASRSREALKSAATPEALLALLKSADAFRRPERFAELLEVARANGLDTTRFDQALQAAAAVDGGALAKKASSPTEIGRLIDEARRRAIAEAK
jgi:tRNA nucleotidyltransferase (CCA-adding enzyme)